MTTSGNLLTGRLLLSQHDTTEHWRAVNRCGSGPDSETVEETLPSPGRAGWLGLTRHIVTGDVGGTKVATLTVHGGGHTWPGSAPVADPQAAAAIGPTAQNLDAATEIVRFARPPLDAGQAPVDDRRLSQRPALIKLSIAHWSG